jgi:uncharacterized protein (DUF1800 family)
MPARLIPCVAALLVVGFISISSSSGQGVSAPLNATAGDAFRFLTQASFGPSAGDLSRVQSLGIPGYLEDQLTQPSSGYPDSQYTYLCLRTSADCNNKDPTGKAYPASAPQAICYRDNLTPARVQRQFFTNAMTQPDQLRQRVAWALAQIMVVSTVDADLSVAYVLARYHNILFDEAFGNFENLLKRVTLSPAMGTWLNMANNDKPIGTRVPNENYAREVLQLFSIGLNKLHSNGTTVTDGAGNPIPTYDQSTIKQFARVFTGWTYPSASGAPPTSKNSPNYVSAMEPYPNGHDTAIKTLLNGVTLPANQGAQQDLDAAIHNIFTHPNVGPFIGRQLIEHLVTSNPGPAYVGRVTAAFNDNGQGARRHESRIARHLPRSGGARRYQDRSGFRPVARTRAHGDRAAPRNRRHHRRCGPRGPRCRFGRAAYSAPSVFNFYPPDFTILGTDLFGPEFGIHNTSTAVAHRIWFTHCCTAASRAIPRFPMQPERTSRRRRWRR